MESISQSVLVVNTKSRLNMPIVFDMNGAYRTASLLVENVDVYGSCSITWHNEHYILGGRNRHSQVAKLIGCELIQVGSLTLSTSGHTLGHYHGACGNVNNEHVYLCFSSTSRESARHCYVASSPLESFTKTRTDSKYEHRYTRIGVMNGEILSRSEMIIESIETLLAVGSVSPNNVKAEMMWSRTSTWYSVDDYPFGEYYICNAPIVTYRNQFLVFGGYVDDSPSRNGDYNGTSTANLNQP